MDIIFKIYDKVILKKKLEEFNHAPLIVIFFFHLKLWFYIGKEMGGMWQATIHQLESGTI